MIYTGTASWNIPKIAENDFFKEGEELLRYASRLNAVEINSSFYRDHQLESYIKWGGITPEHFKFSVKLHQRFTHKSDLKIERDDLIINLEAIKGLGDKLGVLLLQFPAGQNFIADRMDKFYGVIREAYNGPVMIEPRNMTWLFRDSLKLMKKYKIGKVIADPEKCPGEVESELVYYRLHGSPEMYISDYSFQYLDNLSQELTTYSNEVWCIFDNTTFGYATLNALTIAQKGDLYESNQRVHDSRHPDVHAIHQTGEHPAADERK